MTNTDVPPLTDAELAARFGTPLYAHDRGALEADLWRLEGHEETREHERGDHGRDESRLPWKQIASRDGSWH